MRGSAWCALAGAAVILAVAMPLHVRGASDDWVTCLTIQGDAAIMACSYAIDGGTLSGNDLAKAYIRRGFAYSRKHDDDRAIADFGDAIRLDPQNALAYSLRAVSFGRKGDNDRAIADASEAIRLDPQDALSYATRGVVLGIKGDYDLAIVNFTEAIKINPRPAGAINAYYSRGAIYAHRGDVDRAIADFDEAIRLDPNLAVAYTNRGLALASKGEADRAIADFDNAIRLDPKSPIAYNSRGSVYGYNGDAARAIADFNEAIQLDPNFANAYYNRGRTNLYSGALPKALDDLTHAAALNPKFAYGALWLDIVGRRSGLPGQLAAATGQIDMTKWPAPIIRLYLGQMTPEAMLAAADDPDPVKKKDQVCEANFYSGELALQRGARDDAARLFRLAVSDCPKSDLEFYSAVAELKALGLQP